MTAYFSNQNFSRITSPLHNELRKIIFFNFHLDENVHEALAIHHVRLIFPQVLAFPYNMQLVTLDTDTGDVQLWGVLVWEQHKKPTKPIGYSSRRLTRAQRLHDTTLQKCISVLRAALLSPQYWKRLCCAICFEHDSPQWLFNIWDASKIIARWRPWWQKVIFDDLKRTAWKQQVDEVLSKLNTDGRERLI